MVNQIPQWAKKVSRSKLRRLYLVDAQGILDAELIDEVGWALWERCDSILTVTAAHYGHVRCPVCNSMIEHSQPWTDDELVGCNECGWEIPWADYHQTYRGKQLFGANAVESFMAYHTEYPLAQTAKHKMVLIDQLIHAFHIGLTEIGRPAAANLIEGKLQDVIDFLNELSSSDTSAAGIGDSQATWRQTFESAGWTQQFIKR